MPDDVKVLIAEKNGIELSFQEEYSLKIENLADVDTAGLNPTDILQWNGTNWTPATSSGIVTKRKRTLILTAEDDDEDVWLDLPGQLSSNKTYWLSEVSYRVVGIKFSNKKNGTLGDPIITKITAYSQTASSSGNISTSDTVSWTHQGGGPSDSIPGYSGRSWYNNTTSGNLIMSAARVYGFRMQKISGPKKPKDSLVELTLEEV